MNSRHKPSKQLLAATHEASAPDYQQLALATMQAIIGRKISIYIKLPYFCKFEGGFPKGIVVGRDGINDIYKLRVVKLTNWLYEKGYLPDTHKNIMLSIRDFAYKEAYINKLLDSNLKMWDNVVSEVKGDGDD